MLAYDQGIFLSKKSYIYGLLTKMGMQNCKACSTPMEASTKLSKFVGIALSPDEATLYRQICDGLHYVTLTRPDISYSVNKLCQFLHQPSSVHFQALKRLLRYL